MARVESWIGADEFLRRAEEARSRRGEIDPIDARLEGLDPSNPKDKEVIISLSPLN